MHRVRFSHRVVAPLMVGAAALAVPATASAGQDYIVTLSAAPELCASTIAAVSAEYGVSPYRTYTSVSCGFAASMPKPTADELRLDLRVKSVTEDSSTRVAL